MKVYAQKHQSVTVLQAFYDILTLILNPYYNDL